MFIASDHGFTASYEVVYINKWLADQGLLRWSEQLPEDDKNAVFSEKLTAFSRAVDLAHTKAYALLPSCNGIFVTVGPPDYEPFRDELIRRLGEIRGPDGGQVVTAVRKREKCFPGPCMEHAPDLTLTLRDHGLISVLNARQVVVPRREPTGTHHPHGVLLGCGPGIAGSEREAPLCNILDVAPLLLYSLGLEIPAEYEGQVPQSFLDPEYLRLHPLRFAAGAVPPSPASADLAQTKAEPEEETIVLSQLRALGYLD